jgi:hypothetical protein
MHADAAELGAALRQRLDQGTLTVAIRLPARSRHKLAQLPIDDGRAELHTKLERRRDAYESALLRGRVAFAVLAIVTIRTGAGEHRSLLLALTATAVFLVFWNLGLLVFRRRVVGALAAKPALVWIDVLLMGGLILFEAGMASPWMPISMGSILAVGLILGLRAASIAAIAFSAAMLVGYGLMLLLPFDDAGTKEQTLPLGLLLNASVYLAVAGVAGAVGWVRSRLDDAERFYTRTGELRIAAERDAATSGIRAEARRELHASLQQYVGAALIRCDLLRDEAPGVDLAPLEAALGELHDALRNLLQELADTRGWPEPVAVRA